MGVTGLGSKTRLGWIWGQGHTGSQAGRRKEGNSVFSEFQGEGVHHHELLVSCCLLSHVAAA